MIDERGRRWVPQLVVRPLRRATPPHLDRVHGYDSDAVRPLQTAHDTDGEMNDESPRPSSSLFIWLLCNFLLCGFSLCMSTRCALQRRVIPAFGGCPAVRPVSGSQEPLGRDVVCEFLTFRLPVLDAAGGRVNP